MMIIIYIIAKFIKDYKKELANLFCILEITGEYEMALLLNLYTEERAVQRANTRKVENFMKSFGNRDKTDILMLKL